MIKNVVIEVDLWGGSCFFQPNVGGGSPKFCATTRGWVMFFWGTGFSFPPAHPSPLYFLTSPLERIAYLLAPKWKHISEVHDCTEYQLSCQATSVYNFGNATLYVFTGLCYMWDVYITKIAGVLYIWCFLNLTTLHWLIFEQFRVAPARKSVRVITK